MSETTQRTIEQIREHYEVEKSLAGILRNAKPAERQKLYTSLYDEFYRRLPHLPQLSRKLSPELTGKRVDQQLKLLGRFLQKNMSFLEVGPGDCGLALEVKRHVRCVYAVDVSYEITKHVSLPADFQLLISDGSSIPVPNKSIDLAYSNQLMEHLHPDDASAQLKNIYQALTDNGVYVCTTPNRLSGPHDISKHFDDIATGFHLNEYTIDELRTSLRKVGFTRTVLYAGGKGIYIRFPLWLAVLCEKVLAGTPVRLRKKVARFLPVKAILGINLVASK